MSKRCQRHTPEQIVKKLRDAAVMLNVGTDQAAELQALEISESTYERWLRKYGGMNPAISGPSNCAVINRCRILRTSVRPTEVDPVDATDAPVLTSRARASKVQIPSPRLFFEMSPSARASKGFLIAGQRVASSSVQFKNTISRMRRFSKQSAVSHLSVKD